MLGWSDSAVSNYALLATIDAHAWDLISTTCECVCLGEPDPVVEEISTVVEKPSTALLTERFLRCIVGLLPEQQRELVRKLATAKDVSKGKLKTLAENYRLRNEMYTVACTRLGDLGEEYTSKLHEAVYRGPCPGIVSITGGHNHYIIWRSLGGSDHMENRVLLHPNCHRQVHSQRLNVVKPRPAKGV